jgi:hypothetical protein
MNAVESGRDGAARRAEKSLLEIRREITRPYCVESVVASVGAPAALLAPARSEAEDGSKVGRDRTHNSHDASHNSRHAATDHLIRTEDASGHDADAGLCGAICDAEAGEDDGGCAAYG